MKLNETVMELIFELSVIEGVSNGRYLDGEGTTLRNNLLKLFNSTSNPAAHNLIINIMNEAGYPWFERVAKPQSDIAASETSQSFDSAGGKTLSEDEFLELLPANGRIH